MDSFKERKLQSGNFQTTVMVTCEYVRTIAGIFLGAPIALIAPKTAREAFLTIDSTQFKRTFTPQEVAHLYAVGHAVHTFFEKHGIDYRICSGSALGYVRHGGMHGWDDDIDLMIHPDSLKRLEELFESGVFTKETGIEVAKQRFTGGWQCFHPQSPKGNDPHSFLYGIGSPFIDVFCSKFNEDGTKIIYDLPTMQNLSTGDYFEVYEWNTSEVVSFGPIQMRCISNPRNYLTRAYGKDWEIPYKMIPHKELDAMHSNPWDIVRHAKTLWKHGLPRRAIAEPGSIECDQQLLAQFIEEINVRASS